MAYDPQREDYQRLGLRFARSLEHSTADQATRAFATFGRRFAHDRDSLPQSDSDRAFHLVCVAAKLIDYELPFATDEQAEQIITSGHRILDEALSLDPHCYDALRMKSAATNPSFEAFLSFLNEQAEEVRRFCEEERMLSNDDDSDERARLSADIAMRPYLRWVATQAEQALICGRNKEALRLAFHALQIDPKDGPDVRLTAAYAYAKLEDEAGLDALVQSGPAAGRLRPANDAWHLLARLSLAFKRCDLAEARKQLRRILQMYPRAGEALIRQQELPDGVFSRLAVAPYSEDELILALSEGAVLLQEGIDPQGRGVLGSWVIKEAAQLDPGAMLTVMSNQATQDGKGAMP